MSLRERFLRVRAVDDGPENRLARVQRRVVGAFLRARSRLAKFGRLAKRFPLAFRRNRAALTPAPLPRPRSVVTDEQRMRNVEAAVGWEFLDQQLLRDALTHRSYLNETAEDRPSNERLEFLGDSVLGLIVTDYLYDQFPKLTEGELTNIRSALVRTEALAGFAREISLGNNVFVGRGEELNRGRFRPSGLACAYEALLGAVYLDHGYDAAREFALRFVEPALDDVFHLRLHKNGKSTLQEVVQSRQQVTPSYHVVQEAGPDHDKSFTVEVRVAGDILGRGIASSKRAAEQLAAQDALEALNVEA
jgi:ribonuclease III